MANEAHCLFGDCDEKFIIKVDGALSDTAMLEQHLMENHNLVIDSIANIANLPEYLSHWRHLISAETVKVHCFVFHPESTGVSEEAPKEYMFLSPDNPDDANLRNRLHEDRLTRVTELYLSERQSQENLPCIFCNDISLSRQKIFEHLSEEHSFWLGEPDNMVFVGELLQRLGNMVNDNICLYCEKPFRSRFVLKEHMRKRNHRRVKPGCGGKYAKYFISAYLKPDGIRRARVTIGVDPGSLTVGSSSSAAASSSDDDDSEADNGDEDEDVAVDGVCRNSKPDNDRELQRHSSLTQPTAAAAAAAVSIDATINHLVCPFCPHQESSAKDLSAHLIECHCVNLPQLTRQYSLDFQQRLNLLALIQSYSLTDQRRSADSIAQLLISDRLCRVRRPATEVEVALADLCDDAD